MPRFKGEYKETFEVPVALDKVRDHFSNPEVIAQNHGDLRKWEKIDDQTIHYVLIPKSEKGVTFNGEYTCKYELNGNTFSWTTVGNGNIWSTGSTQFSKVGDARTSVTWTQNMECEMKVNRLLAKMIKGIVNRELSKGGKAFLRRMRNALTE